MVILGLILAIFGFLLGIQLLWIIGVVLVLIGLVLFVAGSAGHAVGGRNHWW